MAGRHSLPMMPHGDWDPMIEDYHDPGFNSYNYGPGARMDTSLQHWNVRRGEKREYKLYVHNIPCSLSEIGLVNYFRGCRAPLPINVFVKPPAEGSAVTWGFIYYDRLSDAERAMALVNKRKDLQIKIQFARSEEEHLRSIYDRENFWKTSLAANSYSPVTEKEVFIQSLNGMGRGHGFSSYRTTANPGYYDRYEDLYYDDSEDDIAFGGISSLRSNPEMYRSELSKPMKITTEGGERYVTAGRGYFHPEKRDAGEMKIGSSKLTEIALSKVTELVPVDVSPRSSRMSEKCFQYGIRPSFVEGPCAACRRLTTKFCKICKKLYCSTVCRDRDWEGHLPECRILPDLEDLEAELSEKSGELENENKGPEINAQSVVNGEITTPSIPSKNIKQSEFDQLILKMEASSLDENERVAANQKCTEAVRREKDLSNNRSQGKAKDEILQVNPEVRDKTDNMTRQPNFVGNEPQVYRQDNEWKGNRRKSDDQFPRRHQGNRPNTNDRFSSGRNDRRSINSPKQRNYPENLDDKQSNTSHQQNTYDKQIANHKQNNENKRVNNKGSGQMRNTTDEMVKSSRYTKFAKGESCVDISREGSIDKDMKDNLPNSIQCSVGQGESSSGVASPNSSNSLPKDALSMRTTTTEPPVSNGTVQDTNKVQVGPSTGTIPKSSSSQPSSTSPNHQTEVLASGKFTEVKIVLPEGPSDYWVHLKSREQDILDMHKDLLSLNDDSSSVDLNVGALCACNLDRIWYRTKILAIAPQIKVHYVDYGNTEVVNDPTTLKILPLSALELPAQGIKIKLVPGTSERWENLAEDDSLSVKPTKIVDDVVMVHVEGESYPEEPVNVKVDAHVSVSSSGHRVEPEKEKGSQAKNSEVAEHPVHNKLMASSVSLLQPAICGYLECQVLLESDKFIATIVSQEFVHSFKQVTVELQDYAQNAIKADKLQPKDLVLAKSPNTDMCSWGRACIISVENDNFLVAFCDTGKLEQVTEVKALGREYRNICSMAVLCSVTEYILKPDSKGREMLKVQERFNFEVISTSETAAVVVLKPTERDEPFCKATLSAWQPPFRHNLKFVPLTNGPYSLSTFQSAKDMFVRPVDKDSTSLFARIMQDLNGACFNARGLDKLPTVGDMIAGKFSGDDNYYRALVRRIEDNRIKVTYIDFGNSEVLGLDNVKPLPQEFTSYPCFAVKVILNNVVDQAPNKEVLELFSEICLKELQLKLNVVDLQSKSVELYLPDGTSLNEKVSKLMEPSWKKNDVAGPKEESLFTYNDMQILSLPTCEVKLGVQQILTCNQIAVVNMENPSLIQTVHITMASTMNTYCNEIDQKSYVPRQGETCLACYQGEWFRAVCVGSGRGSLCVMFIDYGNFSEVKHTEVRKMVKDFYETPALTCFCKIRGIDEDDPNSEKIQERLKSLVPQDSVVTLKVVGKTDDGLHYEVEVPHVISTLTNEGLLK